MPLSAGQAACEAAIQTAFDNAKAAGQDGEGSITADLGKEITAAVMDLIKTATVSTSVTGTAAPLAPAGAAPVTGVGTSTSIS